MNSIDLVGQQINKLTVIEKTGKRNASRETYWLCQCACGNKVTVSTHGLKYGATKSCGCIVHNRHIERLDKYIGKKFNYLTVIRRLEISERRDKTDSLLCLCDCGNYTQSSPYALEKGRKKSCGCMQNINLPSLWEHNRKYKHYNERLYGVYKSMIDRCYNPKHREYNNYGGRGIIVCDEWRGDGGYDNFAEWAFPSGYDENAKRGDCTIERIDTEHGIYEPTNCRWASNLEQQNNKRTNVKEGYSGEVHTIAEWARLLNVNRHTLYSNHRQGYSLEHYIKNHNIQYP